MSYNEFPTLLSPGDLNDQTYAQIAEAVRDASGIRVSEYRRSTVLRRVLARMRHQDLRSLPAYLLRLRNTPAEGAALAQDILESSNGFFRDWHTYTSLASCLPHLLSESPSLRVWVPACAGGGDVYSIAMMVAEIQAASEAPEDFMVLGTDIDNDVLSEARRGRFGTAAAERVPGHLRRHYLSFSDGECRVAARLMDRCHFQYHDVVTPPPMMDFDLIDCRSLLGFLRPRVQRRALEQFRSALRAGGLLLAGGDSMEAHADLFAPSPLADGLYVRVEQLSADAVAASPGARYGTGGLPTLSVSLLSVVASLMSESVIAVDTSGHVVDMNRSAELLTGWTREEAMGVNHDKLVRLVGPSGTPEPSPLWQCLREHTSGRMPHDHQLLSRDGGRMRVSITYAPLREGDAVTGGVLLLKNTTEQGLLADELDYRSSHDPITGLLNRAEFVRRLSSALSDARQQKQLHQFCYVDVDQFKVINDTLGHYAGDELLRQVAAVFRALLRPQDALARLGGDEFGVLMRNLDHEQGRVLVNSLLEGARNFRFLWDGNSYAVTVSIGVAGVGEHSESISRLFADADAACYAAKDNGRDRARWVSVGDDEIRRRHAEMTMVGRIGKALDEDQFLLYYEDVVPLDAPGQPIYRELLVRMRGDDGRLIQPASFIAAAERYYLMTALDRWVINAAFDGISRLPADGVLYAINVSGMSLSDHEFLHYVIACLERSGVAPERICFEITETAAISHLTEAVHFIARLGDLGCQFALDDFGAGMASFSYLKNLPVQFVKIDGSFVRSMRGSAVDRGMVETINRLGHEMGLCTIAEHAEDEHALEMLSGIGVDWVQGLAIGPGRPFEDLLDGSGLTLPRMPAPANAPDLRSLSYSGVKAAAGRA